MSKVTYQQYSPRLPFLVDLFLAQDTFPKEKICRHLTPKGLHTQAMDLALHINKYQEYF